MVMIKIMIIRFRGEKKGRTVSLQRKGFGLQRCLTQICAGHNGLNCTLTVTPMTVEALGNFD